MIMNVFFRRARAPVQQVVNGGGLGFIVVASSASIDTVFLPVVIWAVEHVVVRALLA